MRTKRSRWIVAILFAAIVLLGTNGVISTSAKTKKPVSLSKKTMTIVECSSRILKVKKASKVKIKSKTFKSSNKKVATVSKKTGIIKTKRRGKATISVKVKYVKKPGKKVKTTTLKCTVYVRRHWCAGVKPLPTQKPTTDPAKVVGTMRDMTAQELVNEMTLGWNLGDTLDVCAADRDGDGIIDERPAEGKEVEETLWGNPRTTKAMLNRLKEYGFNAVRIPVTWRDHTGAAPDYTINKEWMDRVEEVVRYAYDNGMYVILNIHHDGGGDLGLGAWIRRASEGEEQKKEILARYTAVWQQITKRFQNYSDYLIFESMNEVGFDDLGSEEGMALLCELNQRFVDVIRQSGGNNAKRHLLIAGYWTDIEKTCENTFQMPKDTVQDRQIVSVHYYTPWEFCTTQQQHTWGTKEDLELMEDKIAMLEAYFVRKNIPVIIGEYGVGKNEAASCNYFMENLVKLCHEKGIATFLWDNGQGMHFDRQELTWRTKGQIEALQRAVSGKVYQVVKEEP